MLYKMGEWDFRRDLFRERTSMARLYYTVCRERWDEVIYSLSI